METTGRIYNNEIKSGCRWASYPDNRKTDGTKYQCTRDLINKFYKKSVKCKEIV